MRLKPDLQSYVVTAQAIVDQAVAEHPVGDGVQVGIAIFCFGVAPAQPA
jgi:hypothetical protein